MAGDHGLSESEAGRLNVTMRLVTGLFEPFDPPADLVVVGARAPPLHCSPVMSGILDLVSESPLISSAELEIATLAAGVLGGTIAEHLVLAGIVNDDQIARLIADRLHLPWVSDGDLQRGMDRRALAHIGPGIAADLRAVPLGYEEDHLVVALTDPSDDLVCAELEFFASGPLLRRVAGPVAVARALSRHAALTVPQQPTPDEIAYVLIGFALRRAQAAAVMWLVDGELVFAQGSGTRGDPTRASAARLPASSPLFSRLIEHPRAVRSPRLARAERRFLCDVLGGPVPDLVAVSMPDDVGVTGILCATRLRDDFIDDDLRALASYCANALPTRAEPRRVAA